ncbi:Epoxide hydrolase ascI [Pseudocercospora fuligena]|uniref:Epoxide hydrolase ascI n=1 Tax=Pseudocercospora fuligena TaxID=685502 RepID=A0A8H6VJP9_9PEZI|nr:Epoxide hydrolase ascI [Pseudocercospora fuligena]
MSSYKFLLAGLVPLGVYTLHSISRTNGLFPQLTEACEAKILTDSATTWPTWLQKSPELAGFLVSFFWPLATGAHVTGAFNSLAFVGNSFAMWIVTMIEAGRGGTRGSVISYITIYGLLFQLGGIGVIGPAYLALNLYLSPIPSDPKPSNIAISDLAYLRAVPYALLTGFVLPTLAVALPYPSIISMDTKIAALVFWQAFPLWTSISTYLFKAFFPTELALPADGKKQLPLLRKAYGLGLVLATTSHIAVVSLSMGSIVAPALFRAGVLDDLKLASIFLPTFSMEKIASVGEGGLKFLQWDYAIISLSQIIWAVAQTSKVDRKGLGFSVGNGWIDAALRSAVFGPLGAALTLVWERDEIVLGETAVKKA